MLGGDRLGARLQVSPRVGGEHFKAHGQAAEIQDHPVIRMILCLLEDASREKVGHVGPLGRCCLKELTGRSGSQLQQIASITRLRIKAARMRS